MSMRDQTKPPQAPKPANTVPSATISPCSGVISARSASEIHLDTHTPGDTVNTDPANNFPHEADANVQDSCAGPDWPEELTCVEFRVRGR